jgi:hypothetical protein
MYRGKKSLTLVGSCTLGEGEGMEKDKDPCPPCSSTLAWSQGQGQGLSQGPPTTRTYDYDPERCWGEGAKETRGDVRFLAGALGGFASVAISYPLHKTMFRQVREDTEVDFGDGDGDSALRLELNI